MVDLLWPNFSCIKPWYSNPLQYLPSRTRTCFPAHLTWAGLRTWFDQDNMAEVSENHFWTQTTTGPEWFYSLLENLHWYVKYLLLEDGERSCRMGPICLSWGHSETRPPKIRDDQVKMNRPTYWTQCWLQIQVKPDQKILQLICRFISKGTACFRTLSLW